MRAQGSCPVEVTSSGPQGSNHLPDRGEQEGNPGMAQKWESTEATGSPPVTLERLKRRKEIGRWQVLREALPRTGSLPSWHQRWMSHLNDAPCSGPHCGPCADTPTSMGLSLFQDPSQHYLPQNLSSPVLDVGAEGGLSAGLPHSLDLIFPEVPLSARAVRTYIWPWCVRRGDYLVILCLNHEELLGS